MSNTLSSSRTRAAASDGILQIGTVAVDAVPEKIKTTTVLYWRRLGIQFTKAATTAIAFSSAYTINTAAVAGIKYGVFILQITDAGVFSTKAASADQSYASAALALAAKPSADAGNQRVATIVLGAPTGADWVAQTDDLVAASDVSSITIYDETPVVSLASLA